MVQFAVEEMMMNIEAVKGSYEEQLMRLPNVNGVAIGEKGGKQVIKVFVTHKVPESALRADEVVPKTLEGYPTDVEEIGFISAQTNKQEIDKSKETP
jgi:hypothetical protein